MILEIFLGLSIITVAISWYLIVISLRRINAYEDFIAQFQQVVEYATDQMKQVDADGHYTSDDETGFFFDQLKALQNLLNDIFEGEDTSATQKEKEK